MTIEEQQIAQPWYRQFWPWFIFGLPGVVVVACMVTIYIAVTHPDSVVKDNYYREGLAINRDLAAQQAATAFGVQALLRANALTTDVSVTLQGDFPVAPEQLTLQFIHPNDAEFDFVVQLYAADKQLYIGELPTVVNGRWHLQLSPAATQDWQLKKTVQIDDKLTTELSGQ
ncbi:MAG: FixH family protein [Pseudomonadales bacterium]